MPYFTQALLNWHDSQKREDQDQPEPARVANAKAEKPLPKQERVKEIAQKILNRKYNAEQLADILYRYGNNVVYPFETAETIAGTYKIIKSSSSLESVLASILYDTHNLKTLTGFARALLARRHASGQAAPVIRGEGGMAQDSDEEVMVVEHVPVIRPPSPSKEYDDGEVQLVGTMDEKSVGIASAVENAKLAKLVPSDAELAEYARRKDEVKTRNIEAQAREFERIRVAREAEAQARQAGAQAREVEAQAREALRLEHTRQRMERSRNAVTRTADAARLKEAVRDRERKELELKKQACIAAERELIEARIALGRATKTFEDDERAYRDLNERLSKRPRGGA